MIPGQNVQGSQTKAQIQQQLTEVQASMYRLQAQESGLNNMMTAIVAQENEQQQIADAQVQLAANKPDGVNEAG